MKRLILCLLCFLVHLPALAAEFGITDYSDDPADPSWYVDVVGEIKDGDTQRLRDFLLTNRFKALRAFGVMLQSPGGSVEESMKMGRLVRSLYYSAHAGGFGGQSKYPFCASACVLVYLAAVKREAFPKTLGLHRIFLRSTDGVDPQLAAERTLDANRKIRSYLEFVEAPTWLLDRMRKSSSTEIDWLDKQAVWEIGLFSPSWEEYLIASCGFDRNILKGIFFSNSKTEVNELNSRFGGFWSCYAKKMSPERLRGFKELENMKF